MDVIFNNLLLLAHAAHNTATPAVGALVPLADLCGQRALGRQFIIEVTDATPPSNHPLGTLQLNQKAGEPLKPRQQKHT